MRIAVLTLCRDRIEYTNHCFARLRDLSGPFDHYVLDQGSTDSTVTWLRRIYKPRMLVEQPENVGVSRGMNVLLDLLDGDYDAVVKFDNDCELTRPGTLDTACRLVAENPGWILSPKIEGLNSPPGTDYETDVGGERVAAMSMIGGIFMAVPGNVYRTYRYETGNPIWGMDDVGLCHWWKTESDRKVGYLLDHRANHYETTAGQQARYPAYFERKAREFAG